MKRVVVNFGMTIFFAFTICALAGAQSDSTSLGAYARSIRKNKPEETQATAKVYDNDNISSSTVVSVVGESGASNPASSDVKTDAKGEGKTDAKADAKSDGKTNPTATSQPALEASKDASKDPLTIKPEQSAKDRQKAYDAWKQRIDDQRKKVDQLTRELSELQNKVPSAILPTDYKEKYKQDFTEKQKALDQAKAELSDLLEKAHRSGVPSSLTE